MSKDRTDVIVTDKPEMASKRNAAVFNSILPIAAILISVFTLVETYRDNLRDEAEAKRKLDAEISEISFQVQDKLSGLKATKGFSAYTKKKEDLESARRLLEKLERLDPESVHPEVLHRRGQWLIAKGRYDEGIQKLMRSIEIDSGRTESYVSLSMAYISQGQYESATRICDEGLEQAPKSVEKEKVAELYSNKGMIWLRQGEFEKAKMNYLSAINLAPDYYQFYVNLGIVEQQLGNTREALRSYEAVINLNREHPLTNNNLCTIYFESGEIEKASDSCQLAVTNNESYWHSGIYLSRVYEVRNDLKSALEVISNVIANNRDQSELFSRRAEIYRKLGLEHDAMLDDVRADLLAKISKPIH